ncbi:MAG: MBL fold metallo-hydrolase [Candidatus Hodarchaeales archaeon]|jgi:predicted metal-dependent RNase
MLEISVLGASDSVGKSCVMISDSDDRRVILDAGIQLHPRRTGRVSTPPDVDRFAEDVSAVLISHAHIDHSAYSPALYRAGYNGPIHMTTPTKDIVHILWKDHLKIEGPHHYGVSHLQTALMKIETHNYRRKFKIANGITAELLNASHILGSAIILLDWEGTRILYTGDFNDAKTPYHDPIQFPDPDEPIDILITETTNANRRIEGRKTVTANLTKSLLSCYSRGGKAIIPSFALGRSQEIQAYLASEFDSFLHKFPLYVDGMILDMNAIYERYMNDKWVSPRILIELKEKGYRTPFDHKGIRVLDDVAMKMKRYKKRELLINREQQSIILTTSGMMEGGPVYDYLRMGGSNSQNGLYIVGYQVDGTMGSDIANGQKNVALDNGFGQVFDVSLDLEIKKFQFSGHSSLEGLVQMVQYSTPQQIYAIHGEPSAQERYADEVRSIGYDVKTLTSHDILQT